MEGLSTPANPEQTRTYPLYDHPLLYILFPDHALLTRICFCCSSEIWDKPKNRPIRQSYSSCLEDCNTIFNFQTLSDTSTG